MKINYSYKPSKDKVLVGFYNYSQLDYYKDIYSDLDTFTDKYDIQLKKGENINIEEHAHCELKHALILTDCADPVKVTEEFKYLLNCYDTMSIGIVYKNNNEMLSFSKKIEKLKGKYNNIVNYLRPDFTLDNGYRVVSQQKILDNAICDTIRVKYIPKQNMLDIVNLTKDQIFFFNKMSELYTDYKLYHRASSDGFFALRHSDGFYITATKTDKSILDLERISFVHGYDEIENQLSYSGKFLPSSDVVEASYVFKDHPEITALIHTHASDKYTRNLDFAHKIKVEKMSYGEPELGKKISDVIGDYYNDFIILEEHGEVFAITGALANAHYKVKEILNII